VKQDGGLPRDAADCLLTGDASPAAGTLQPPSSEIAVRAVRTQLIVGGLDQEATHHLVAGLGPSALRVTITGLPLAWAEPEVGAHGTALREASTSPRQRPSIRGFATRFWWKSCRCYDPFPPSLA
jgi:hypothetical protein